jgi:predicted amidophosphoribosyltransferase
MTTSHSRTGGIDRPYTLYRGVTFASCYVYSPAGLGAASERSRHLRALLKTGDTHFLFKYAARVRQQVSENSPLEGYLRPTNVLVPIPGSARTGTGTVPVAEHLATALIEEGLGQGMWRGLHRIRAVRKSATAAPGARPTVANHYDSFAIEETANLDEMSTLLQRVVLIDDVVTKGRTLLATAMRVQEALPNAEIRAFALLRTMGLIEGIDRLLEPCVGEITWRAGDACRNP